jgi:hypothetical protein
MDGFSDLDCRIFIETAQAPDAVAALLVSALAGAVVGDLAGSTIGTVRGEFELRRNKEADRDRAGEFPDGFLYFRHTVEYYPRSGVRREDRVSLVALILSALWDHGLPAVAVCDYENELPKAGGYKDRSIPWPAMPLEAPANTPNGSPVLREGSTAAEKPAVMD